MARRGQFETKRPVTWNDQHDVRLVFTEMFKRTEDAEQEQGYGGERREEEETNHLS
jgi:hypothetical protein